MGDLGKNYYMVINVENGKVQIKRKKVEYDENAYQKDFQTTSEKFLSLARKKDLLWLTVKQQIKKNGKIAITFDI